MSDTAVMALVAMVGTAIGLVVQMFSRRDQLQYDVKLALLEASQKRCEADGLIKDARIVALEAQFTTLHETDASDKAELEAKIEKLNGKADTGLHVPIDPDQVQSPVPVQR